MQPAFKGFHFGFVTFKEISTFKDGNWIIGEARKRCNLKAINSCTEIYDEFPVFFYIADENKNIVASHKVFPDFVVFKNEKHMWSWPGDTFTDERFRKKGLARFLIQESTKVLHCRNIGRGMVFSNDITLGIYRKEGWCLPGYVDRYLMVKGVRPIVAAYISVAFWTSIIEKILQPLIYLSNVYCLAKLMPRRYNFREIEIDDLEKYEGNFSNSSYKDKIHFNCKLNKILWKLRISRSNQKNDTRFFFVYQGNSEIPVGYFVIRSKFQDTPMGRKFQNFKLMTLMDYGVFSESKLIFKSILCGVVKEFLKSDCEILEIISNSVELAKAMKINCFFRGGRGMSFAFSAPESWAVPHCIDDIKSWHLTHFSGDGFSF